MQRFAVFVCLAIATVLLASPAAAREFRSYAIVGKDGTLRVNGRTMHLYGIYIPNSGRTCDLTFNPTNCGERAALALDSKIDSFVRCIPQRKLARRTFEAVCYSQGQDLGAYLISEGWAVAARNAPFEYQTLERIAENRGVGVWGFRVDRITRRRR